MTLSDVFPAKLPSLLAFCASVLFMGFGTANAACVEKSNCDLREYMSDAEFQAFKKSLVAKKKTVEAKVSVRRHSVRVRTVEPDWPVVGGFQPREIPIEPHPGQPAAVPSTALNLYLRKDFADVSLFDDPTPTASASGAEFSYSRDSIVKDSTYTGTGLVALAYRYLPEDPTQNRFVGWTIAPYFAFNRELHSRKLDDNVDTKTIGLSAEIGFQNPAFVGADYFRVRANAIRDDILMSTNVNATFEWAPTYAWVAGTIPGTLVNFNLMPSTKVQYDSTTAAGKVIAFSGRAESLRVGPEATLILKYYGPPGNVADFFRQFSGNVTYHWWNELYSGRSGSWLDTSLIYNIDPEGHIGLKFAYKRGESEETGAKFDLYKITLAAKFCADLVSKTSC